MATKSCMSGRSIELREGGRELSIRFPFDPALVTVVRALPKRRFDARAKCWSCPVDVIVAVVDALLPHDFEVAATARDLYAARGGTRPLAAAPAEHAKLPPPKCTSTEPHTS